MEKIIVRGTNWIGDVVMTLPFYTALKAARPDSRIYVLTRPHLASLYENHPAVSGVIDLDESSRVPGWKKGLEVVRSMHFNSAVCLPHSFSSALFMRLAGVPRRYGRACNHRQRFFTHPVYGTIEEYDGHQMDFYLELAEALTGVPSGDVLPRVYVSDKDNNRAEELIGEIDTPVLGLFASAAYGPAKIWPESHFVDLADSWIRVKGGSVVLFGGKGDVSLNDSICRSIGPKALNLGGRCNLLTTVAVMSRCDAVVANDSGPMHLAAASGTRTVGIFGSTNPVRTAPRGERASFVKKELGCSPCMRRTCEYDTYDCLRAISADDVLRELVR